MESSSESNFSPKQSSKSNHSPPNAPAIHASSAIAVKKEEPEDDRVDPAIAIFDDVDGDTTDDESELVDSEHVGFVEHNGVNCWVCPGFRIPQIPMVSVVKRPLQDLCDAIKSGDIILDPEYQRDVVWDDMRCEGLLVSLLMGYLPPPIIFNVKLKIIETPDGKLKKYIRTCVDGKQRLTSILRFMRGEIGFLDAKHKKWYYASPVQNGKKSSTSLNILPEEMKKFFMSRFFICYEYNELSQSTEEEMFQLVQRGIALTPAEKMRAMSTEWANFARKYEEDYTLVLNLSKQGRASGFRLTLTIFAMVQEIMSNRRKATIPTLQASPQALTRMLEETEPINPVLKLKMKEIFDRYEALVRKSSTRITTTRYRVDADSPFDPAPKFLRGDGFDHVRTFSPLELISAALLISYHMSTRSDEQLLNDVKEMRRHLRERHKDLRVNAQCWTTAWEYIVKINSNKTSVEGTAGSRDLAGSDKYPVSAPTQHNKGKKGNGTVIRASKSDKTPGKKSYDPKKFSGPSTVSVLGQSGAGLGINGDSDGTSDKAGLSLRRSARSGTEASAEAGESTVGMSARVTTGHHGSTGARTGKHKGPLGLNTEGLEGADASDSSASLSSISSGALDSPGLEDRIVNSHKRNFDDGTNSTQSEPGAKKPKH